MACCRACVGRVVEGKVDPSDVSAELYHWAEPILHLAPHANSTCLLQIADLEFTLSEDEIAQVSPMIAPPGVLDRSPLQSTERLCPQVLPQLQGMALICMSRPASDTVRIETQSDWGYSLGVAEWKGATGHIAGKQVRPLSEDL